MRDRVDAFGVAEPELARTGEDQIEVNLPGVEDAERAARQVGSTAQLFFYDWEKNVLDENCKTNDTEINGGQQPVTGLYNAVKRASKCEITVPKNSQAAAASRFYAFDKVSKKPFNNGIPASRAPRRSTASPTRRRRRPRSSRSSRACSSCATRRPSADAPDPDALLGHPRRPGPLRHRHQEPGAELRPARRQRAERHLRLLRQGPQGVPGHHAPRSRSAAPTTPTRSTRTRSRTRSTSRSRSTTSSSRSR